MNAVISRFNTAATTYDRGATAQQRIAMDLAALGSDLASPGHIVEHGCGTGFFTSALARAFPNAHLIACDPSPGMIRTASENTDHPVTWVTSSAESFIPGTPADLIASASALHWCPSLPLAMSAIRKQVTPDGHLLLAIMTRGTLGELHELRRELFPQLLPDAQLPEDTEILSAVTGAGFRILEHHTDDYRTDHVDAAGLFRSLHDQGITSGTYSHGKRLMTRTELKSLVDAYNERYSDPDKGVIATFRAIRLIARAE